MSTTCILLHHKKQILQTYISREQDHGVCQNNVPYMMTLHSYELVHLYKVKQITTSQAKQRLHSYQI